jgi:hypothetical protein
MILYHYTAGGNLRGIAKEGLTVGDVPTDIQRWKGRVGVWLTSSINPNGHGLVGSANDKKRFRIEVDVDDASPVLCRWDEWSLRNVTPETRRILSKTAAQDGDADFSSTWWLYFGWIKPDRLIRVIDTMTGEAVEGWSTIWPEGDSVPAVSFRRKEAWQKNLLRAVRQHAQGKS